MWKGMKSSALSWRRNKGEIGGGMDGMRSQDECVKCDWAAGEEEKEVERWAEDCWVEDRYKKMKLETTNDVTGQREAREKREHGV